MKYPADQMEFVKMFNSEQDFIDYLVSCHLVDGHPKNGISAKSLQKVLGLGGYQNAWTWLHKFRRLMVLSGRSKLEGVIEVDEAFVDGKTPGKCGRGAEGKSLVAIVIEVKGRKTGGVRLEKIPNASASSLKDVVERNI